MADDKYEEKKYTFVQETIRPKKRSSVKRMAVTIGTGAVFGVVSAVVFCLCLPLLSDYFKVDKNQIVIGRGEEEKQALSAATTKPAETIVPSSGPVETEKPKSSQSMNPGEVVQSISKKVNESIVKVNSMKDSYDVFDGASMEDTQATCGIVVGKSDKNLLIYVNKDSIDESQNQFVTFRNNKTVQASVYSKHEELRIAILAVELSKLDKRELDTVKIADFDLSDNLKTGEEVFAFGNPNGHMYSFAYGYISNEPYNVYIVDNSITLINTTIDYNAKGDGVLVNASGRIIGMITRMSGGSNSLNYGLNTCYSIKTLEPIITKLVNRTPEIYIGMTACDITSEIAYKTQVASGLYITEVENNSPAFYADLKKGDIITAVNDETVASVVQFNLLLNGHRDKDQIFVTYLRNVNGKQVKKKVAVELSIVK